MKSPELFRKLGDPPFIGKRGKTASRRMGRYDGPPGKTGTERHTKDRLMRQFIRGFDGPRGTSEEFRRNFDSMIDPVTGRMKP